MSTDTTDWKLINLNIGALYGLAYGNGKFVVVGANGYISNSSDGATWTPPKQIGSVSWTDVIYHDKKFITVGIGGYVSPSTDGETWTTPIQVKDELGAVVTNNLLGIVAIQ